MPPEQFDFERIQRESEERDARMKKTEEDGLRDIVKYFDRIHDNIFTYNNLLIGAYFALAQFQSNISRWTILFPLINLWFLIWIDYRMMEKSRYEASIMSQPFNTFDKHGKKIRNTNLLSLLSILTTLGVTIVFLYYLLIVDKSN